MSHDLFDTVRLTGHNIRVHGNGFIQIDLKYHPGVRLHVFGHPLIPKQRWPTPIHNHVYSFDSRILSGSLINLKYVIVDEAKTHRVCTFDQPAPGEFDTKLNDTGQEVALRQESVVLLRHGDEYSMTAGFFHETFTNEPTVTIMKKRDPYLPDFTSGWVLCRIDQPVDNNFYRQAMDEEDLWTIVYESFKIGGILHSKVGI